MTAPDSAARDPVERARVIAKTIAKPVAHEVDACARFPHESIAAIRDARLLSATIPQELGGAGVTFQEVGRVVEQLARGCASTAMIYAMHQIQVACLVRHATTDDLRGYLAEVAARELLLASATSEVGTGGDIRRSICALVMHEDRFALDKRAAVVSYGEFADAILATSRRTEQSPASDQVLVLCEGSEVALEQAGSWETLGFRGTCGPPFRIKATGRLTHVFAEPFSDILAATMQPTSHAMWGSVWLGMATEAYHLARDYVQEQARRSVGVPPGSSHRLVRLASAYHQFETLIHSATLRLDTATMEELALPSALLETNAVKVVASELVVDIVGQAMMILGMAGYRTDGDRSLGRLLRDAYGAPVMVSNDRIMSNSAHLILAVRG